MGSRVRTPGGPNRLGHSWAETTDVFRRSHRSEASLRSRFVILAPRRDCGALELLPTAPGALIFESRCQTRVSGGVSPCSTTQIYIGQITYAFRSGPMNKPANNLIEKIESKEALVCVVGLGYVGLPLAVVFAEAGFRVVGIDVDPERVRAIGEGRSYVPDVATETLASLVSDGKRSTGLTATTSFDSVGDSDAVIVCVPTPLSKTKDPELFYIVSAVEEIARRLRPGALVVLESTTYPGTTEDVVLPMLQAGGKGYEVGVDFFLAFSPERTDPGRTDWTIVNTPKVVGGSPPGAPRRLPPSINVSSRR